jgi:hypothetical protein
LKRKNFEEFPDYRMNKSAYGAMNKTQTQLFKSGSAFMKSQPKIGFNELQDSAPERMAQIEVQGVPE